MRVKLGLGVDCIDGPGGTVRDVVIDSVRRRVTHLVVERHRHIAYLVPIEDVERVTNDGALRISRTASELEASPEVEESAFLRLGEWPQPETGD
jgi:hypothetical protein